MAELSMPLSKNFVLKEFLRSSTAERDEGLKQEQENPPPEIIDSLQYLVDTTLQPIRDGIGYQMRINSGYRSPILNKLVGGSVTSQHCKGEAADCELSRNFLTDPALREMRDEIKSKVRGITGRSLRADANESFYLFAHICLNLEELDVDQVIHEYGEDFTHPAWVHVSASRRQNKRQMLFIGRYTNSRYIISPSIEDALAYGTSSDRPV